MNRSELFPSRYVRHADLLGRTSTVVIETVMLEDVGMKTSASLSSAFVASRRGSS